MIWEQNLTIGWDGLDDCESQDITDIQKWPNIRVSMHDPYLQGLFLYGATRREDGRFH